MRMGQRGISRREVESVLAKPELSGAAREGRQAAWAEVEGRGIMVIHEPHANAEETVVVTVYPRSRRPRL